MTLFYNAHLYTVDPLLPTANAMVVEKDRIKAVGAYERLREAYRPAKETDLEGKTVLPGFFDAHAHVWKIGDLLTYSLDLRSVRSMREIQQRLEQFSETHTDLPWIRARGYNEALLEEGRLPNRHDIDEVIPDKPVFLQRTCAHIATVNTKALEVCSLTVKSKVPFGGSIDLGEDGMPNGIIRETALGLVTRHFPETGEKEYEEMILAACGQFIQYGITSVSDPAVMPDLLKVYLKMDKAGKLPVRIHAFPIVIPDGDEVALPVPERYESEHLVIHTVKFFADGGLSGKTAAISEPYKNTTSKGVLRLKKETFLKAALQAQRRGFQIATHAIGDRAIEMVLEVYRTLYKEDKNAPGHRIEHLGLPTPAQLSQMNEMGIHAVTQPVFIKELGKNFRESLPERFLQGCYPFRSMLDHHINVAFSSDAPVVTDLNPLSGIQAAVNRKDAEDHSIAPQEKISLQEALYCYTRGSAIASRVARQQGSLSAGKKADFIVLSASPFKVRTEELHTIKVEQVWCNGVRRL